jgi:hypothetical protein
MSAILPLLAALAAYLPVLTPQSSSAPRLSLGRPSESGFVAVVPILVDIPISHDKYITLSEAIKQGLVEVVEIPGKEEVNSLEVRNRSDLPLILFAGELLLGGKQDRIVGKDTIVPKKDSRKVPVFCVEHGRWRGGKMSFEAHDAIVPDSVRWAAVREKSQKRVWDRVSEANALGGASSGTGTVQALLRDPRTVQAIKDTTARLRKAFDGARGAVGVICWLNGEIHSADLFANAPLFAASRDKLLQSYAVDARLLKNPRSVPINLKACSEFLDDIVKSRRTLSDQGQFDALFEIKNGKVTGYEAGARGFGGLGGGGMGGFGHGSYKPGR